MITWGVVGNTVMMLKKRFIIRKIVNDLLLFVLCWCMWEVVLHLQLTMTTQLM